MTNTTNAQYLRQMAEYARKLRSASIDHAAWAEKLRYIRINGGDIRPISLCNANPCGQLAGYGTGSQVVDDHIRRAIDVIAMPCNKINKKELRIQARLVEFALRKPEGLPALLHLEDRCDALYFVTDELRVNDIRADVLLLGKKGDVLFPVFIELKARRDLDRLLDQLKNIVRDVSGDPETLAALEGFVVAATGARGRFDFERRIEMIIWPAISDPARARQSTKKKLNGRDVLEFASYHQKTDIPRLDLSFVRQAYSFQDEVSGAACA